jgi:hypothetical protein
MYVYDPIKDTWIKKVDLPETPVGGSLFASTVVAGKIIVTGDFSVENPPNVQHYQKVFIYDPKNSRWSEGKVGPMVVQFGVVGVTTGVYASSKVYILGLVYDGFYSVKLVNQVYDPVSDMWSSAKALSTDRVDFGVATVDDILYVIGGYTSNDLASIGGTVNHSTLNEQYIPLGYTGALPPVTSSSAASESALSGSSEVISSKSSDIFESKSSTADAGSNSSIFDRVLSAVRLVGSSGSGRVVLVAVVLLVFVMVPVVIFLVKKRRVLTK